MYTPLDPKTMKIDGFRPSIYGSYMLYIYIYKCSCLVSKFFDTSTTASYGFMTQFSACPKFECWWSSQVVGFEVKIDQRWEVLICCHWQGMNSIDFLTGRKCSFYWLTSCLSLRFTTSCWKVPFHKDRSYYNQSRVPDEKTANGLVFSGVACLTPINLNICSSFIKIVSMTFSSTQQIQFQSCSLGVSNSRGVNRIVPSFQTCARWEICYKDRTHRGARVFADPIWERLLLKWHPIYVINCELW